MHLSALPASVVDQRLHWHEHDEHFCRLHLSFPDGSTRKVTASATTRCAATRKVDAVALLALNTKLHALHPVSKTSNIHSELTKSKSNHLTFKRIPMKRQQHPSSPPEHPQSDAQHPSKRRMLGHSNRSYSRPRSSSTPSSPKRRCTTSRSPYSKPGLHTYAYGKDSDVQYDSQTRPHSRLRRETRPAKGMRSTSVSRKRNATPTISVPSRSYVNRKLPQPLTRYSQVYPTSTATMQPPPLPDVNAHVATNINNMNNIPNISNGATMPNMPNLSNNVPNMPNTNPSIPNMPMPNMPNMPFLIPMPMPFPGMPPAAYANMVMQLQAMRNMSQPYAFTPNGQSTPFLPGAMPTQHMQSTPETPDASMSEDTLRMAADLARKKASRDAVRQAELDFLKEQEEEEKKQKQMQASKYQERKSSESAEKKEKPKQRQNSSNVPLVDSIPDDPGCSRDDHVSLLNQMAQRGTKCSNLAPPIFKVVKSRENGAPGVQCTMSVRVPAVDGGDERETISMTVVGKNKKGVKHTCAKAVIEKVTEHSDLLEKNKSEKQKENASNGKGGQSGTKEVVDEKTGSNPGANGTGDPENNGDVDAKKVNGSLAISALHRLYAKHVLVAPPDFKDQEPIDSIDGECWRAVVVLNVADHGKHTYNGDGASKKYAKYKCAMRAIQSLMKLGVDGLEEFKNVVFRSEGDTIENGAPPKPKVRKISEAVYKRIEQEEAKNKRPDICQIGATEDEKYVLLPLGYKLLVVEREDECEEWFKRHGKPGSNLGLFIDSSEARRCLHPDAELRTSIKPSLGLPLMCFSTATHGLVVLPQKSPITDENEGNSSKTAERVQIPPVLLEVLEDPDTKKYGIALDDGLAAIQEMCQFEAQGVNDISIATVAVAGLGAISSENLTPFQDLSKYWLEREIGPTQASEIWADKADAPSRLLDSEDSVLGISILSAHVSAIIRRRMQAIARKKRTQLYGTAMQFTELSERLMRSTRPQKERIRDDNK